MSASPPSSGARRRSRYALPLSVNASLGLALAAVLVCWHSSVAAQGADSVTSPVVPLEAGEIAHRKLKLDYSATPVALRIVLPPADSSVERKAAEAREGGELQIGFNRAIPLEYQSDLSSRIDWVSLPGGSLAGAVSVTSPGALAMRVGFYADLSGGGEIRFFGGHAAGGNPERGQADHDSAVVTWADLHEVPELLWSPTVEGDTVGLEITLPSTEALSTFFLIVEEIAHIDVPTESLGHDLKALDCSQPCRRPVPNRELYVRPGEGGCEDLLHKERTVPASAPEP